MEQDNIQSVIDKVASTIDPEESNDDTQDENLNGNQDTGDSSNQDDDQGTGNESEEDEESKKQHRALAAQRVRIKELEAEIASLKANKDSADDDSGDDDGADNDNANDPLAVKDTDSEEVKLLKAEIAEMKKNLTTINTDREKQLQQAKDAQLVNELTQLQKEFKLDRDALLKFADDANAQGLILGQSNLSVKQIYQTVYFDQLMQNAAKAVEDKTNENLAPGVGPNGSTGNGAKSASIKSVLDRVAKKAGLN